MFFIKFVIFMQEFTLELAAGDFRVAYFNKKKLEKRESDEYARTAPKINSRATDGGYFPGRPMEPEGGPAKIKEAQAGLHFKQHGLDKEQACQPVTS